MTKFGYHNGLVDQAYTDVMESICVLVDHAKVFHSLARTTESSLSRERSTLTVQGIAESQTSSLPFSLMPDNMENVHRPMTALTTWNSGQAVPSQKFKSFGTAEPPTKRARVSSNLASQVSTLETSKIQDITFSVNVGGSVDPKETQQEISDIVDVQNTNHKTTPAGQSMGQKKMTSDWLSTINHQEMHNFHGSRRYRETGVWLSTNPEFKYWRDTSQSSMFWLHGARRLSIHNS